MRVRRRTALRSLRAKIDDATASDERVKDVDVTQRGLATSLLELD